MYAEVKSGSAATFRPTCFIVTSARAPPYAAPSATSNATFSFGAQRAFPPSAPNASRISVEGVPGYPVPSAIARVSRSGGDGLVSREQLLFVHGPLLRARCRILVRLYL